MAICMKKQSSSYLWSFEEQKSCAAFVMPGFDTITREVKVGYGSICTRL